MSKKVTAKLPVSLLISILIAGCATTTDNSDQRELISGINADSSCEQILDSIETTQHTNKGSDELGLLGFVSGGPIGVVALPLLIAGGALSSRRSRAEFRKVERHLDELIVEFRKKGCTNNVSERFESEVYRYAKANHDGPESSDVDFFTPELETLTHPKVCHYPIDVKKRVYQLGIKNIDPDEYLRFTTIGENSTNYKIKALHLTFGEVLLPRVNVTTRKGGHKRGLWVERLKTGEKRQLNYLPPKTRCNSKSRTVVKYENLWIMVKES